MILDLSSADGRELAEKILQEGSVVHCRCRGHSMSPLLCDGDVAVVRRLDPECCRVGYVVLASRGDTILLHRIVQIHGSPPSRRIVTGGDNQRRHDREAGAFHIFGRLSSVKTGEGTLDCASVRGRTLDYLSRWSGRFRHGPAPFMRIMGGWMYRIAFLIRSAR